MKVLLLGGSGMVGGEVLSLCLKDDGVKEVLSIGRRNLNVVNPKLKQIIRTDFLDYSDISSELENIDVCHFCIGTYTGVVSRDELKLTTFDYPVAIAEVVKQKSPNATFCFLSGAGADLKEKSRSGFAKFKGMAENKLMALKFKQLSIFRPGYIYPVAKREEPNWMYRLSRRLYPLLKLLGKNATITSTQLAKAMFLAGSRETKEIMENKEIIQFLEN